MVIVFNMNLLRIFIIVSFIFFASCSSTSYNHSSGDNSHLKRDSSICRAEANLYAPTYICRNPFMCAPDEFQIATQALIRNGTYFKRCIQLKGYDQS
jgi:hypothetical protein